MDDPIRRGHFVPGLDGVRGLAILAVLALHTIRPSLVVLPPSAADGIYLHFAAMGWMGVDLFFVLSGYLITGILVRNCESDRYFRNFYARRSLRIFPLYYLVVGLLFFGLERSPTPPAMTAAHLLYYQNYWYWLHPETAIDPARNLTWSLAIEEQFYLLWPALVRWTPPRLLGRVCLALIVGSTVLRCAMVGGGAVYTKLLTPCRLDCLCAGALLAVSTPVSAWVWRLLGAGAAGLLWLVVSRSGPNLETPAMESVGLIGTTLLSTCLVALAAGRGLFAAVCHTAVLRAFGKYSYCIYLTHWLVLDLVTWIALQEGSPIRAALPALGSNALITLSFYLVGSCSCLGVAMISWHLLEKRFLSLKRYFPSL